MENNRNWPGIAALVLAGLALFVALAGHGPSFDFSGHIWSGGNTQPDNITVAPIAVPAAPDQSQAVPMPAMPAAPSAPDVSQAPADAQAKIAAAQADAHAKIAQAQADLQAKIAAAQAQSPKFGPGFSGPFGPGAGQGMSGPARFSSFMSGPGRVLGGLARLVVFGVILLLIFRFVRRRKWRAYQAARAAGAAPAAPPPPELPPPGGPRPTVKL